jgi:hypothetical protein
MLSLRNDRGLRSGLAARVATTCTVVAALVPVMAGSASAYVPCPTVTVPSADVTGWATEWPTPGADPKGVTECLVLQSTLDMGYLQIVDLRDGAKLRLHAEVPWPWEPGRDVLFKKHTASDWYSFIRAHGGEDRYNDPAASRLFSTTNASFFKNADNGEQTKLPFPHLSWSEFESEGVAAPGDPDWEAPKRSLRIGYTDTAIQKVRVASFPTYYTVDDFWDVIYTPGTFEATDATIGFDPLHAVGTVSRRNYLGVSGSVVYILTTNTDITNAQAMDVMQTVKPGMAVVQLDGGGSAQTYSEYGEIDSSIPWPLAREVPDVLAVYRAP